ncbi:MAG: hypothetical protein WC505_05510 [Patescibacteria group bacterium]
MSIKLVRNFLTDHGLYTVLRDERMRRICIEVSKIPFGEGRTVEEVLGTKHAGTCTGKHSVLQACFDALNIEYRPVVCVFRWDEQGIEFPLHLRQILSEGAWGHGHDFVQVRDRFRNWIDVDVTFDSALSNYGFRSFPQDWDGAQPFLGVHNIIKRWDDANVDALKREFVDALTPEVRERRERFLTALFAWLQKVRR